MTGILVFLDTSWRHLPLRYATHFLSSTRCSSTSSSSSTTISITTTTITTTTIATHRHQNPRTDRKRTRLRSTWLRHDCYQLELDEISTQMNWRKLRHDEYVHWHDTDGMRLTRQQRRNRWIILCMLANCLCTRPLGGESYWEYVDVYGLCTQHTLLASLYLRLIAFDLNFVVLLG